MTTAGMLNSEFSMEHEVYSAISLPHLPPAFHTTLLNMAGTASFSYVKSGSVSTAICKPGNILMLVSYPDGEKIRWAHEVDAVRISIASSLADRILETNGFRLKPTHNVEDPFIRDVNHLLLEDMEVTIDGGNIYRDGLIVAYIVHLASMYSADNKKIFAPRGKLSSNQLKNVIDFTQANIHRNIRLAELACCVHLSEFHFARLFRQTMGVSPYKFVLEMKIASAKSLIRSRKRSFSDIAYMLNFSDQAHFSHVFKKLTGSSPRHFSNVVGTRLVP